MKTHFRRITKFALFLLIPATFLACGGGGGGGAEFNPINNVNLNNTLKGDNPDFPGVASFIDTKVVFQGSDMFLGLTMDPAVKALITKNTNSFLGTSTPVFDAVISPLPDGVTVDPALRKIVLHNGELAVSWQFSGNSVVRSCAKLGAAEPAVWTFTYSPVTELTTAVFKDPVYVTTPVNNTTTKSSYTGVVKYIRSTLDSSLTRLATADFTQTHSETNSATALTWILDGSVKMVGTTVAAGDLSFTGVFSFDLPPYKTVSGNISLTNGTYGKGFNNTYFNQTNISSGGLIMTSQTDYSTYTPAVNVVSLRGAWSGTFDDSCSATGAGRLNLSVSASDATWSGMSSDSSRFYGVLISIDASGLHLKNNGQSWGYSTTVSDTSIAGKWSLDGCGGSFNVVKQP